MKKRLNLSIFFILIFIIEISFASSMTISDVSQDKLYPGEQSDLTIEITNNLGDDVSDVSILLDLSSSKFITVGSSEDSDDEIREDKTKTFNFIIKASPEMTPGDYNIPYTLNYKYLDEKIEKKGTVGISVGARTDIEYSLKVDNPIQGQKGKINFIVTNKGLGDLKFVLVKVSPNGFNLISSPDTYIGTINSDDFESASFDVIYTSNNPRLIATVEYKDVENKEIIENIDLPIKIYSIEEATKMGLMANNNYLVYAIVIIILIIIYIIWRILRSRKKRKANKG